ncbi:amidohydrolase family protein [Patescibacteria group bacterium]|nr:amidohydrolase family protein [Patescibacteria group bacterium]MBU1970195.1 amidohydrolase family protein [Patescibacteria group bacterium]
MAAPPAAPQPYPSDEILVRQELVLVALGRIEADLIISGATVLDVHTLTWMPSQDIVIKGERIAWVGPRGAWSGTAAETVDAYGYYAVPGFGEPHNHIESSHLAPDRFAEIALPKGTTWVAEASHEFGNVDGEHNAELWLAPHRAGSPLTIFPQLGSAIPPTPFEFTGGYYDYAAVTELMASDPWVIGLGEVMDWPSVWNPEMPGYERMWQALQATWDADGVIEGHGSRMFTYNEINAFAAAGLSSDHEIREGAEVLDKLQRGIFIQLRYTSMAKVIPYLVKMGLADWTNLSWTTDDRSAEEMLSLGAMNFNLRMAIQYGVPVEAAYASASYTGARHWHIEHLVGSIAPGRYAHVILLRDPETVDINRVWASGKLVGVDGKLVYEVPTVDWPEWATDTINIGREVTAADFVVAAPEGAGDTAMAAVLSQFYFAPTYPEVELPVVDGAVQRDVANNISKFCIVDRYNAQEDPVACMFWRNVGPATPDAAFALSEAHDNHNIQVMGTSDEAMAQAVNYVASLNGGYVLILGGQVVDSVQLEIGGLMSARPALEVAEDFETFWNSAVGMSWLSSQPVESPAYTSAGLSAAKSARFQTLTCQPWKWVLVAPFEDCPSGFVNVTTGECREVVR